MTLANCPTCGQPILINRLEYSDAIDLLNGFINREHICKKFDVSVPQASFDLRDMNRMFPCTRIYRQTVACTHDGA